MSLILHASDLHFGKALPETIAAFHAEIERQNPDLVIISGDFTQIGSREEFIAAREFIKTIRAPVFTVPGNHDIPRFGFWQRLLDPLKRYRDYIGPLPDSIHETENAYIVGINTARPVLPHWNWANGMVSARQIDFVHRSFRYAPNDKVRIFVCHHPLVDVKDVPIDVIVWNSKQLLDVLHDQQISLVLTGHVHHASFLPSEDGKGPVMVGSASATSTRLRSQSNGYNLIRISPTKLDVELIHWDGNAHVILDSLSMDRDVEFADLQ